MNSTILKDDKRRRARNRNQLDRKNAEPAAGNVTAFETRLRWMAIVYTDDELQAIVFGQPTEWQAEDALVRVHRVPRHARNKLSTDELNYAPKWVRRLIGGLKRFAEGEPVDFSGVPIAQSHLTPFGRRVTAACRRIGWGNSSSYGELAARCGATGAARAVGSVMAKNRFPLVVPCHRVLGAGGKLGGYSAPGGLNTKRQLLENEKSYV